MKVTLQFSGREITVSKEELLTKLKLLEELEQHFFSKETILEYMHEISSKPTENKHFKVTPHSIDVTLFAEKRNDLIQEWTRTNILLALGEITKKPERYSKPFLTLMPRKSWKKKTVQELISLANTENTHIADWVEQSLEWAQRITNGESWEELCNLPDISNWYRLVIWQNNCAKIVGGSHKCGDNLPPSIVFGNHICPNDILHFTVPLIVTNL